MTDLLLSACRGGGLVSSMRPCLSCERLSYGWGSSQGESLPRGLGLGPVFRVRARPYTVLGLELVPGQVLGCPVQLCLKWINDIV